MRINLTFPCHMNLVYGVLSNRVLLPSSEGLTKSIGNLPWNLGVHGLSLANESKRDNPFLELIFLFVILWCLVEPLLPYDGGMPFKLFIYVSDFWNVFSVSYTTRNIPSSSPIPLCIKLFLDHYIKSLRHSVLSPITWDVSHAPFLTFLTSVGIF